MAYMDMEPDVFERLSYAAKNDKGIELSPSEVWLLMRFVGDGIEKSADSFRSWCKFFDNYELVKRLDNPADI